MIWTKPGQLATLLLLVLWGAPLHGQDDDSLKIKKDKAQKKFRLTVLPAGGYDPETGVKLGMTAFALLKNRQVHGRYYRPSTISSYFLYTFNGQLLSKVKWRLFLRHGINLTASAQFFDYPEQFFGVGNDARAGQSEQIVNKFFSFDGQVYKRLTINTFVGLTYDLQHNWVSSIPTGSDLLGDDIHGLEGGRTIGMGPAFKVDSRDNVIYPTKGIRLETEILMVTDVLGSEYNYINYRLDFRKFKAINDKNIFALQSSLKLTSGDEVPFYKLPKLGGIHRLRGIQSSQLYRDKQAIYLQVEYRRKLPWRFGGTIFAGTGDVARKISDLQLREFKYVVGGGLRFAMIKDERLNLRLDWGMGPQGQSAFYIAIKEAF